MLSNLSQTPFAHATRLIKYRNSVINFTLFRRARIKTCLSSLTFAQFLIFNFRWNSFRSFSSVCEIFSYFQLARDEIFCFQTIMRSLSPQNNLPFNKTNKNPGKPITMFTQITRKMLWSETSRFCI